MSHSQDRLSISRSRLASFGPAKAGRHRFRVTEASVGQSKNTGTDVVRIAVRIVGGDDAEKVLTIWYSCAASLGPISELFDACGCLEGSDDDVSVTELIGREFSAELEFETDAQSREWPRLRSVRSAVGSGAQ